MVIFGGYKILNALIAEAEKQEKAREKPSEDNCNGALLLALSPVIYAGTLDEVKSSGIRRA
jgi:hypothetical protein